MTEDLLPVIQEKLDSGKSMYRIAKEHGISQSAITYHIKKGTLKKADWILRGDGGVGTGDWKFIDTTFQDTL